MSQESRLSSYRLFRRMLTEEWRLHAALFGSRRFLAFPMFVTALAAAGFYLLSLTGTDIGAVIGGLHALVFFFGLQVGTIGLVGRDALRDVLGDVTLLVFAARTLPVTWRRLLAVFLVKDLTYYSLLFLAPLVVAFVPTALAAGLSPVTLARLAVTLVGVFGLGIGLSLTLAGLSTRGRWVVLAPVAAGTVAVVALGIDPVAFTPYAAYESTTPVTILGGFTPAVLFAVLGPLLFRPSDSNERRTVANRFGSLRSVLSDEQGIFTRSVLDVGRSSGSYWKVAFSLGVIFGITALLLQKIAVATTLTPSPGIAFGTLLGLGTFTTYNWLTQFDDPQEYLRYPVSILTVFEGKLRAHLLLSLPVGFFFLGFAALWYPVADLLVGLVVFPLVTVYVFGATVYVAGLSPGKLLFDTGRFLLFGVALAALSVPLLVAALAQPTAPRVATGVALVGSLLAGAIGLALTRRAGPRWEQKLRTAR
jgi:hypothetical protein